MRRVIVLLSEAGDPQLVATSIRLTPAARNIVLGAIRGRRITDLIDELDTTHAGIYSAASACRLAGIDVRITEGRLSLRGDPIIAVPGPSR